MRKILSTLLVISILIVFAGSAFARDNRVKVITEVMEHMFRLIIEPVRIETFGIITAPGECQSIYR